MSPPILNLPTELVLAIAKTADPVSAMALTLSCKGMYGILFSSSQSRLNTGHIIPFLNLLQRDLGGAYFVCLKCIRLDRNQHGCRLVQIPSGFICNRTGWQAININQFTVQKADFRAPFSTIHIAFVHVQRTMDSWRHLERGYGAPLGALMPVNKFGFEPTTEPLGGWQVRGAAKVVLAELFFACQHTKSFDASSNFLINNHKICPHHVVVAIYANTAQKTPGIRVQATDGKVPAIRHYLLLSPLGENVKPQKVWSCAHCVTDYTGTAAKRTYTRPDGSEVVMVDLTINSYHGLGPGDTWEARTEEPDWKWSHFAGIQNPEHPPKRGSLWPAWASFGTAKESWERAGS